MKNNKKKKPLLTIGAIIILSAIYFLFFMNSGPGPAEDPANLIGAWVRTDAPYKIEVLSFDADGGLKATYSNPQPINVGTAKWEVYEGQLQMYVELQDVNYPGSNYTLTYTEDPEKLAGTYFQAVVGETYSIEFTRLR